METEPIVLHINQGSWCCFRIGSGRFYYLNKNDNRVWLASEDGIGPDHMNWQSMPFDEVPEEVKREYMVWRLSK